MTKLFPRGTIPRGTKNFVKNVGFFKLRIIDFVMKNGICFKKISFLNFWKIQGGTLKK
jgi:hypothetical protein